MTKEEITKLDPDNKQVLYHPFVLRIENDEKVYTDNNIFKEASYLESIDDDSVLVIIPIGSKKWFTIGFSGHVVIYNEDEWFKKEVNEKLGLKTNK